MPCVRGKKACPLNDRQLVDFLTRYFLLAPYLQTGSMKPSTGADSSFISIAEDKLIRAAEAAVILGENGNRALIRTYLATGKVTRKICVAMAEAQRRFNRRLKKYGR
jgi:hypothetical protein